MSRTSKAVVAVAAAALTASIAAPADAQTDTFKDSRGVAPCTSGTTARS